MNLPSRRPLFRQEVIAFQQQNRNWGRVVPVQPVRTQVLVWFIITAAALIVTFLFLAQYARKETVAGYLMPAAGTARIFPQQTGIVSTIFVEQGQAVEEGQPLLAVTTNQIAANGEDVNAAIVNSLTQQKDSLNRQIAMEERRTASERDRLSAQMEGLEAELGHLTAQLAVQRERIHIIERMVGSGAALATRGLVSQLEQRRREEALLEQRQALNALSQQVTARQSQLTETRFNLEQLPFTQAEKIQVLRNELSTAEQRMAEVNGRRSYIIRAPIAGRVSSLQASVGQPADPQRLQVQIVPMQSPLQAELFIPARAIGFVEVGQPVRILYEAFPYQHFGSYRGRIERVSQTMLTGTDVATPVTLREPAYRATVMLDRPDIDAYGKKVPLQPDMLLRADIILERRTLIDWILNPLLSARIQGMIQEFLDFGGRRRLPSIMQTEAAECGLACLAMVASFHGHRIDLNTLRRRHPVSLKGVTLRGLIQVANQMHLACRPLRYELDDVRHLNLPAIVHWDMNHFVVLKEISSRGIIVHDPAAGVRTYSTEEASKHLTGVALELSPAEGFAPKNEKLRLPFRAFWGKMTGASGPLTQIFVLSIIMEALVIAAPFYLQLTVDEVVARGDVDLMLAIALGFGLLTVINVATTALRAHIVLVVQNALHFQMGARLFHHLVRLPLTFFEKRHIGDVLSRFNSIEPIRNALAEGLILATIDGIMALATLAMIFIYSPKLALVVLAALFLYVVLRLALYRKFRDLSEAEIQAGALESSNFIESARAIQSIKLFNREADREGQWLNRHADTVNANIRLGRAQIQFKTINSAIFGIEHIVTIYLAAMLALDNVMTVGMIFAFMAYKSHFTSKASTLVEKALEFRLLELHLERISDIAMNPIEPGHDRPLVFASPIRGGIELRNVSFRYAETERFVLENVSLKVEAGQFVTIMGPSGGGKTTLLKIMLGLLDPTSGEVLVDGVPLHTVGVRVYREQVAAVMQEDHLLSGSIADNICFFDPSFDHETMVSCAQMAGVHDEIMAMPMAYNSLIGDMGNSLSGGQKQRILLARALYKRPKILFLDEGTAHLDVEKEQQINERLRRLSITRISVAHRPGMMNGADAVLRIGQDPA